MNSGEVETASAPSTSRALRLIVMALLALFSAWVIAGEVPRVVPDHGLWDFGAFVASGRAAAEGMDPYGVYPPLTPHVVFPGFESWNPNLNPPISALLFQAFDLAAPEISFRLWSWISIACYTATVLLLLLRYRRGLEAVFVGIWAVALAGFWDTLYLGQIYLPLVLAAVGAWLLLERGEQVWSGILIGIIIAIKPNFLVWPVLLFLSGHRKPSLVSVATAAVISAIPLLLYGPGIYIRWLELVASDSERAIFLTNASLSGLAARMGMQGLGTALGLLLLLALAAWALWRRPTVLRASALALVAALLASPLGWIHYTLFLLPVLFWQWDRWAMWIVGALLVVPVPFIIAQFGQSALVQSTIGSAYAWALILCLVVLVLLEFKERPAQRPIAR